MKIARLVTKFDIFFGLTKNNKMRNSAQIFVHD